MAGREPSVSAVPSSGWRRGLPAVAIALASSLPYLPAVASPFIQWDDLYYVVNAPLRLGGWRGLALQWDLIRALDSQRIEFFPLRDSVYWALWQLFGANPVPYHLTNLAFHALTSILVWRLGLRLGLSAWVAISGALTFAVHPIHVESVVWISALKDPMFLSAMLGSLVCYLRYRETLRPLDYGASLVLLMAALACKSLALPTVAIMVVAERWLGQPTPWRLIALRMIGPLAITAVSFGFIVLVGKANGVITGPHGGTWSSHWVLMSWALVRYIQQAVFPLGFRLHYCFPPSEGLADPRLWVAAVLIPLVAVASVVAWKKNRPLGLLCFWFFACLGPVANVLPFPALIADRYLYAPTVGSSLLIAWLLSRVRWRTLVTAGAVATLAVVSTARSSIWKHEWQLWDEVFQDPACWKDHSLNTFNALLIWGTSQSEPEFAIEIFRKAAERPEYPGVVRNPNAERVTCDRFLKSVLLRRQETLDLEVKAAEVGVMLCGRDARTWERLALANWKRRPDIARRAAAEAYRLDQISFRRYQLGLARANDGDVEGAIADLQHALTWEPEAVCPSFIRWLESLSEVQRGPFLPLRAHCDLR